EDGIRAFHVTGVQTCALPIFGRQVALGTKSSVLRRPDYPAGLLAPTITGASCRSPRTAGARTVPRRAGAACACRTPTPSRARGSPAAWDGNPGARTGR